MIYYMVVIMINSGKRFEQNFKDSVPEYVWCYRFKDGTSSWAGGDTRFQATNICDFLVMSDIMWLLELKHTKGVSLPFGNIKDHQIEELYEANQYDNINAGLLVKLRKNVFYVDINKVKDFIDNADRKSIPLDWFEEYGIKIPLKMKQVNYTLDLNSLFG